jgi:3-hydroxyacyl-[acyl-carrier-protein] dehydratase
MRFECIDRIVEWTRGDRIVAVKAVTRGEEYLADHFPTFPVLPGVLMLEVLVEAAGWLVRDAQDFPPVVILLREAKNVVFKSFVRPGDLLRVEVACRRLARGESDFEGSGYCHEEEVVKARFGLTHVALSEGDAGGRSGDERLTAAAAAKFRELCR